MKCQCKNRKNPKERSERLILDKIIELCKKNGISISKLEKECEIGNGTIPGWRSSSPRLDTLKKVADYFGVSIEYFVE